jgi:hypothetical protein
MGCKVVEAPPLPLPRIGLVIAQCIDVAWGVRRGRQGFRRWAMVELCVGGG